MKIRILLIGLIIFSVASSPVMAISKTDLISQYRVEKPATPSPEIVKSTTTSLLDMPEWTKVWLHYPTLYDAWRFNINTKPCSGFDCVDVVIPK
jgi:hypothetical protein